MNMERETSCNSNQHYAGSVASCNNWQACSSLEPTVDLDRKLGSNKSSAPVNIEQKPKSRSSSPQCIHAEHLKPPDCCTGDEVQEGEHGFESLLGKNIGSRVEEIDNRNSDFQRRERSIDELRFDMREDQPTHRISDIVVKDEPMSSFTYEGFHAKPFFVQESSGSQIVEKAGCFPEMCMVVKPNMGSFVKQEMLDATDMENTEGSEGDEEMCVEHHVFRDDGVGCSKEVQNQISNVRISEAVGNDIYNPGIAHYSSRSMFTNDPAWQFQDKEQHPGTMNEGKKEWDLNLTMEDMMKSPTTQSFSKGLLSHLPWPLIISHPVTHGNPRQDRDNSQQEHAVSEPGEKRFRCTICGAGFTRSTSLQRHQITHTGEKPHKCGFCGAGFARKSYLHVHIRTHTGEKPYKCDICDAGFVQSGNLQVHKRTHTGEKPWKCDVCNAGFAQNSHLQIHKRTHTGEKPYKCEFCGVLFKQIGDLQIHERSHTGERPYKCDVCGDAFARSGHLQSHKRKHTGEKPFKCDICGARFTQGGNLLMHKRTHTGEKPYKCEFCGVGFVQKGYLQIHERIHTGEKPFKCEICGAGFARSGHLKNHTRKHTGEKPYKCDICGAGFAQNGNLQVHKKTHITEKPYKCEICDAEFSQMGYLQRHQVTHTGEKPYKCQVCGADFAQNGSLQRHIITHTKEEFIQV